MKHLSLLALRTVVLLVLCVSAYVPARDAVAQAEHPKRVTDIAVDVSSSLSTDQMFMVRLALANMGDREIRLIPWSSTTHTPFYAPAELVAEYLAFSGGQTNLYGLLDAYNQEDPMCGKLIVFVDGVVVDDVALREVVDDIVKQNRLVFVQLYSSEYTTRWYKDLSNSPNLVSIDYSPDVLTDKVQDKYPPPGCTS